MRPRVKQALVAARRAAPAVAGTLAPEDDCTPEAFADAVLYNRERYTAALRARGYSVKGLWRWPAEQPAPAAAPRRPEPIILIIKRGARS